MSATPPVDKSSAISGARASGVEPPPEPFGQIGVGRFVLPVLAAVSLVIASVSGAMWYRSLYEADTFARTVGGSGYQVRSIVGRILIYRIDFDPNGPFPISDTTWNYSSFPIVRPLPDGW